MDETQKPAMPSIQPAGAAAQSAPVAPPSGQAMDVVAPPPAQPLAEAPADTRGETLGHTEQAPEQAPPTPPKPKAEGSDITKAIVATVVIVVALAGLAVMAFLSSKK